MQTAALAGAYALGPHLALAGPPAGADSARTRIRVVFSHHALDETGKQKEPGWPYLGYDAESRKKELLGRLRASCPGFEFLPATAYNAEDGRKILQGDKDVDGYVAYMLGGWANAGAAIAEAGRPILYVGDLYGASGELLIDYAAARRKGLKVAMVSSSKFEDVVQALKCFETMRRLRASTILCVGGAPGELDKAIQETFGTTVKHIDFPALAEAYRKADPGRARELARRWTRQARKVVEPSPAEIEKCATMYLGMRAAMESHQAQAITINCLGGFYSKQLGAYPCLGHFELNNEGLVGACEADLRSTMTMLIMKYLVARPGYISDPVLDTGANRVVYLHCVAPSKVSGPGGKSNPYEIRSHAEDRKGASVRSLMPLREVVTTLLVCPVRRQMVFHQAKTEANVDDDKSCRSKLAAQVLGDMDKLQTEWDRWGWHRVTFYGDHKQTVRQFCALNGITVVDEA